MNRRYAPIFREDGKIGPPGREGAADCNREIAKEMAQGKQLTEQERAKIAGKNRKQP